MSVATLYAVARPWQSQHCSWTMCFSGLPGHIMWQLVAQDIYAKKLPHYRQKTWHIMHKKPQPLLAMAGITLHHLALALVSLCSMFHTILTLSSSELTQLYAIKTKHCPLCILYHTYIVHYIHLYTSVIAPTH